LLGTKNPGNESSSERKVQGMKVPRNFGNFRSLKTQVAVNERGTTVDYWVLMLTNDAQ